MHISSSHPSSDGKSRFDTGPLSWVIGEIREALTRSRDLLCEALLQDTETRSTTLRQSRGYLHQAHGALQIIDVDGVTLLTEAVEALFDGFNNAQIELDGAVTETIVQAYQALLEYLEELLAGTPHQPVRLFPYYRALLEARGVERIHPADLFFPNLSIRPQLPVAPQALAQDDYVALRKRFERGLLLYLKGDAASGQAGARLMCDVLQRVEQAQFKPQARVFWWVLAGFLDAIAQGNLTADLYAKQLLARINLQIRRLGDGSESIAERLLHDALFFLAYVTDPAPLAQQIRAAYRLDGMVPHDYERRRYGKIDAQALAMARERLVQAKLLWNRIAAGDVAGATAFQTEITALAEAAVRLDAPALAKLLRELSGIARHAAHTTPGDALSLEIATSLLFIEQALQQIAHLPEGFAERADALTARLLSAVAGESLGSSAAWLDDISREAQQRQTINVLAGELQTSLRQVEKRLDAYFRDPLQYDELKEVDGILYQIAGALAVLDQDEALRATRHVQQCVRAFVDADSTPPQHAFEQVAQNVGALSFFIDALGQADGHLQERFRFDDATGLFHAGLTELAPASSEPQWVDLTPAEEVVAETDEHVQTTTDLVATQDESVAPELELQTVEDELRDRQLASQELARSLAAEPDNAQLQDQLKASLEQVRMDATLVDNPDAGDRARSMIDKLASPDFIPSQDALEQIGLLDASTIDDEIEEITPLPAPESEAEIDAELLEIFLSEAVEVLACVQENLPASRLAPHNEEYLTTLRRCFHTLKGSSRMVGLNAFGETAWSIEQVLNLRLAEGKGGDQAMYVLLARATELLGAWVSDLQIYGSAQRDGHALIAMAERVKRGEPIDDAAEPAQPAFVQEAELDALSALPEHASAVADSDAPLLEQEDVFDLSDAGVEDAAGLTAQEPIAEGNEEALAESNGKDDLLVEDVVDASASDEELEENAAAAIEHFLDDEQAVMADGEAASAEVSDAAAEETLDATSASNERQESVEFADAAPVAPQKASADVIDFPGNPIAVARAGDNIRRIGDIEISVPLHTIYLSETDELVRRLEQDFSEWRHEPERQVSTQAVHAAHSLAGSSATVGFAVLHRLAHALENVLQYLSRKPVKLILSEYDLLDQALEQVRSMLQHFALGEMPSEAREQVQQLEGMLDDFEYRSLVAADSAVITQQDDVTQTVAISVPSDEPDHGALQSVPMSAASEEGDEAALLLRDEIDADLLPVFIEEGRDILPQMGELLRAWEHQTDDVFASQAVLRLLHTLKGSARMAGAMTLGQHFHEMESYIENAVHVGQPAALALDDLLWRYDQALQLFEQLQNGGAATPSQALTSRTAGEVHAQQPVVLSEVLAPVPRTGVPSPTATQAVTAPTSSSMVRVRADILDRLVNQAGEVSISRSRLENEVGTIKQSLGELSENVARLRDQLREIEMQAESQISSSLGLSAEREFDPLEFDRFTRLQELTRMMAESVSDVGTVQQSLNQTLESASSGLASQARLTRDLQQDLMRVRMVQFASIAERLYRVTRQTAKEVDKRVNLDIRGGAVEIDRGVLERMTGPFEHLLRNAIVHGIESREERRSAGKNDIGELRVEVRQEGNEVVIQFSDDGQGLNLDSIRSKAASIGLLTQDAPLSEAEASDLIFHPGFSTADEVTELAGRGIGMDVVRSEAASLGGRVITQSARGAGASFTIHLPLTLAVTQVVLLSTGGRLFAVPAVLVEQVQQLKSGPLTQAYNDGAIFWQSQRVPMYFLSALLGDEEAAPVTQQYSPVLILKSGSERVAVHVDEVIGSREVVVKNIGPQLSRMIGIAGATVLGSGEIVLILNPVPLAQRALADNLRAPRMSVSDAPADMGAVAEMTVATQKSGSDPVQGLRSVPVIMVVDDSLTVRRVTQRLLTREGYQVVVAKDGVDALQQLQSVTPDVMLVDIEMPRMDGFDLTRNVRDDERTREIPIIMITSRTAAKHRNVAMSLGVNAYLGKPYQEDRLLELIAGFVGRYESIE
ncbi:Hpt domain-containing protein [uncultured Oxalicibacterium sp.]|uniref:hybrid sensor histidine kinase/response regulator n=1 Tax=uncultured Oxalicibacterium sp. TaxID=1168540 RepID=UPI0025E88312|nr:Hpt domain-containing protein [uncultured Oxalicibacterium sp.]